jgi:short subunit dehydrogenase-like uncharacterized protein
MSGRKYDIVLWGATGFTGRLAARYLYANYRTTSAESVQAKNTGAEAAVQRQQPIRIAIAGRSESKLLALRSELISSANRDASDIDIVVASLEDAASMDRLAASAVVVLSTAGPYALVGSPVVDACVRQGTSYVDITGETQWVRSVIDCHHDTARQKRIKIVSCCGFDCIPSEYGCRYMVSQLRDAGLEPKEVNFVVTESKGSVSGGTLASMINVFASSSMKLLQELLNPFFLNPRDSTGAIVTPANPDVVSRSGDRALPVYDRVLRAWTMPHVMQAVDYRVVNRSNALLKWGYGKDFVFSEGLKTPNFIAAALGSVAFPVIGALMVFPPSRWIIQRLVPQPGEGPSAKMLEEGFFRVKMWAKGVDPATGEVSTLTGGIDAMKGDPGYAQTARMVSESAVCLALQARAGFPGSDADDFGVITPSVAFKDELFPRLENIGFSFYKD